MKNLSKGRLSFSSLTYVFQYLPSAILYLVICGAGVLNAFSPTLLSRFAQMQTDPGDTRLNNYFLEHSFQLLTNSNYIGKLWSPAFFYPYKQVLAFSDNLFGAAPIYWVFRAFFSPDVSFQIWMIVVSILCFASFAVLMRHLRVNNALSALGAFLFAFSLPRLSQIGHQQLLPQFFTPLAFLVGWEFVKSPTRKRLASLLLFTYLQVLAGIYLGWFWLFSLFIFFGIVYLLDLQARTRFIAYCRDNYKSSIAIFLAWISLMGLTLFPYIEIQRVIGGRSYSAVDALLPRIASWFSVPHGSLWSPLLSSISKDLPMAGEHSLFAGLTIIILTGLSLFTLLRFQKLLTKERNLLVKTCLLIFLIFFILSLRLPSGLSLWRIVYEVVPGATAIRAVARVWTVAYFYLLVAVIVCFDSLLHILVIRKKLSFAIISLICFFGVAEQIVLSPPSYEKAPYLQDTTEMRSLIQKDCNFAYVSLNPQVPFYVTQLSAMWAGLGANIPVINGYSGNTPPNYGDLFQSMTAAQVVHWLGEGSRGQLCMVSQNYPKNQDDLVSTYSVYGKLSPSGRYTSSTLQLPLPKIFSQEIRVMEYPTIVKPSSTIKIPVFLKNTSNFLWSPTGTNPTNFSYHWVDANGKVVDGDGVRTILPWELNPGDSVALNTEIKTPGQAGSYSLTLTMVQELVAWFSDKDAESPKIPIAVTSP